MSPTPLPEREFIHDRGAWRLEREGDRVQLTLLCPRLRLDHAGAAILAEALEHAGQKAFRYGRQHRRPQDAILDAERERLAEQAEGTARGLSRRARILANLRTWLGLPEDTRELARGVVERDRNHRRLAAYRARRRRHERPPA